MFNKSNSLTSPFTKISRMSTMAERKLSYLTNLLAKTLAKLLLGLTPEMQGLVVEFKWSEVISDGRQSQEINSESLLGKSIQPNIQLN